MLRKQRKRLVCLKGPSLGYGRARSLLRPSAFIVDDFDKCVIRRKSKNFTRSGSSYPPLTGCLQFHYVNVSVLIKLKKKHTVFLPLLS